ncbi:hypothetical protein D3C73_1452290 [compost metagenome]
MALASLYFPSLHNFASVATRFGNAFPTTEIIPAAPSAIIGKVTGSSPEINKKSTGLSRKISLNWAKFPEASFIAMIFEKSLARRNVVCAVMLLPVRPGTLYNIIGKGETCAIAL